MIFSNRFVCASEEYCTLEKHVPNPQFRKSFSFSTLPSKAELTICGLGYYELFLNGQNITKGYMAPYRSNPDHYLYYDHYEITQYLQEGENVIGVLLGNGLLNADYSIWDFDKAPFRSSPKVALCLEADGNILFDAEALVCSDSPITFDEFHFGEYYDARLEQPGWTAAGFDDSQWRKVLPAKTPLGEPRLPDCEPIGIIDIHHPARIIKSKEGYIYDFVVNCAGLCELNIKGQAGQELELRYGEVIRNGELDQTNIGFKKGTPQRDRYILRGEKSETYMPHFTYHGFRFVEVIGLTEEQATLNLLTFYEMSSSFDQTADFICDNADINAIFDATIHSDRANFYYFPTDCPQREKNGWTGDAALSAEQLLMHFDCARSLKEWLRNIFKAQNEEGTIPGIVPTDTWGFAWGNGPAWDNVMFETTYRLYQYTGDKEFIREAAPYLLKYLHYMETKQDEDGLYHYGLGDWVHINLSSPLVKAMLPHTDTITCKSICDKAAKLFEIIGDEESAAYAKRRAREIKAAYRKISTRTRNQTTYSMELYYGMIDPEEIPETMQKLKCAIASHSCHLDVGVLGNRALLRSLGEQGETELALKLLLNPSFPSLKYLMNKGYTALPEGFHYTDNRIDSLTEQDSVLPSLNHHFWGDVIAFFMRHLAGIQVESVQQVVIAPSFSEQINNLSAHVTLPAGKIEVSYKKQDIMVELTVDVPIGVAVTVAVPKGYQLSHGKATCKAGENRFLFCKL